jgi:hypothetical protein
MGDDAKETEDNVVCANAAEWCNSCPDKVLIGSSGGMMCKARYGMCNMM